MERLKRSERPSFTILPTRLRNANGFFLQNSVPPRISQQLVVWGGYPPTLHTDFASIPPLVIFLATKHTTLKWHVMLLHIQPLVRGTKNKKQKVTTAETSPTKKDKHTY
jgi:hypothetical protein